MNLKPVVKLMNFHALMRVDSAKKRADKQIQLEARITDLLDVIMNNRNFIFDKHVLKPNPLKPPLRIYIGSDFGFCGSFNNRVNALLAEDDKSKKILIGRKLLAPGADVLFACDRADYDLCYEEIKALLVDHIARRRASKIEMIYNRYLNISQIELVEQTLFPLSNGAAASGADARYRDDFLVEGDVTELLISLIATYIDYELRIASDSSYAAENILRQGITTESLDKIEEREQQRLTAQRKAIRHKEFLKVLESYSKTERRA